MIVLRFIEFERDRVAVGLAAFNEPQGPHPASLQDMNFASLRPHWLELAAKKD